MKSLPRHFRLSPTAFSLAAATWGVLFLASPAGAAFPDFADLPKQSELPALLQMSNGSSIQTPAQWMRRRVELKAMFQHYMYGQAPPAPAVRARVERKDSEFLGGKATLKEVVLQLGPGDAPRMGLLLAVPNGRRAQAPVFVGLNFCGNHTAVTSSVALPAGWMPSSCSGCVNNQATEAGRGAQVETWAIDQSIERGYAVAIFYNGDVEPDRPDAAGGIRAFYARRAPGKAEDSAGSARAGAEKIGFAGRDVKASYDWGTIAAWAWGLSRAVDYLVTDGDIDPRRIAVVGHSRNGKAALLAGAFDERIALVIPLQAGCGGTAPSRGKVGESVKQINDRFPHWFNAEIKKFNIEPDRLPFDQHALVALCAPRPVLFPNALEDTWANPDGQFEMLKAADPVYRLLGSEGLGASVKPELEKLLDSRLGYYIRPGKHSMTRGDWKIFLDFADKHLK